MQPTIPLSLRVLVAPTTTMQKVAQRGEGFFMLLLWLVIEFVLLFPVEVARTVRLAAASPASGLAAFVRLYANYAIVPAVLVLGAGVLLHYGLRMFARRKVDIAGTTAVVAYAWPPHVLMVALGGAMYVAFGQPAALHMFGAWTGSTRLTGVIQMVPIVMSFVPTLALLMIAYRSLAKQPSAPEQPAKLSIGAQAAVGGVVLLILAFGAAASGLRAGAQWEAVRPVVRGDRVPPVHLVALDGSHVHASDLQGKVVLIDFWATWCPPCVASMPHLQTLYQRLANKEFVLLSVNTEPDNIQGVRAFAKEHGLTFPIYVDDGAAQLQFQVTNYPTAFLIDQQGTVQKVYIGSTNFRRIRGDIDRLLTGLQ